MAPSAWACRTPNAKLSRYGRLRVPAPLLPPMPTAALESASGHRCVRPASVQNAGKLSAFRGEYQLGRSPSSVLLPPTGRKTDVSKARAAQVTQVCRKDTIARVGWGPLAIRSGERSRQHGGIQENSLRPKSLFQKVIFLTPERSRTGSRCLSR